MGQVEDEGGEEEEAKWCVTVERQVVDDGGEAGRKRRSGAMDGITG